MCQYRRGTIGEKLGFWSLGFRVSVWGLEMSVER